MPLSFFYTSFGDDDDVWTVVHQVSGHLATNEIATKENTS